MHTLAILPLHPQAAKPSIRAIGVTYFATALFGIAFVVSGFLAVFSLISWAWVALVVVGAFLVCAGPAIIAARGRDTSGASYATTLFYSNAVGRMSNRATSTDCGRANTARTIAATFSGCTARLPAYMAARVSSARIPL